MYKSQSLPREPGPLAVERPTNRCSDHNVPQNVCAQREARQPLSMKLLACVNVTKVETHSRGVTLKFGATADNNASNDWI